MNYKYKYDVTIWSSTKFFKMKIVNFKVYFKRFLVL